MAHFVHQLVEVQQRRHRPRRTPPSAVLLSALVDDCIGRGKSLQEGGAIYNFTGPQAFGIADTGDPSTPSKNRCLRIAPDAPGTGRARWMPTSATRSAAPRIAWRQNPSLGERDIYEVVKRIIDRQWPR